MSKALDKLQTVFAKMFEEEKKMKGKDPCWKGYEMIGMKKKNGKDVPNCVPKNEEVEIAEAKVGDTVSFHHELKSAPGSKVKKSGTVEKVDGDVVHVKVKDKYGVKRHQIKMSDVVKEEVEQIDELSKDTLKSYKHKAGQDARAHSSASLKAFKQGDEEKGDAHFNKSYKRVIGVAKAIDKLQNKGVKEEVELEEASDTKRPPNFTMHPIDRQDYKILKDPKKKPLPKDSKEWGRDGGEKKMKEEVELDEAFSDAQIARLKTEYSKISGIDPDSESYKRLIALLDKQDKATLQKLADSGIKFISGLARNRVIRMKEDVDLEEAKVETAAQVTKHFEMGQSTTSGVPKWVAEPVDNPKLADKFMKSFKKMKTAANVSCKTYGTVSTCEETEIDEAAKAKEKGDPSQSKNVKKGEPLSGKQEPVKLNPELQEK